MGWYQPVDGQRIITIFNPIYDNYEGYDHAVKIEKIWHALTKSVEPLTSENDEEYGIHNLSCILTIKYESRAFTAPALSLLTIL